MAMMRMYICVENLSLLLFSDALTAFNVIYSIVDTVFLRLSFVKVILLYISHVSTESLGKTTQY